MHQRAAQALQLGRGFPAIQILANGGAHGAHVGSGVRAQGGQHLGGHGGSQVGVIAVEVLGRVEFKPAHGLVVQALRQAHWVGYGHQHQFATQEAGCFGGFEQRAQVVGGQHAGQLFRVQAGLDVDLETLGTAAGRAKVKAAYALVAAQAGGK